MSENTEQLKVTRENLIGRIVLNQPEKHNAISLAMWQGLATTLDEFQSDPQVRIIIVEGAGTRAFSAGADISQFEKNRDSRESIEIYNRTVTTAQGKLRGITKPTIAKIRGYCLGGGLGVALCCDLRLTSDDGIFGIPAARLGLGYGIDSLKPLVTLIGPSRAQEILFTAKRFDAAQAQAMGLVNQCVPTDQLDALVQDYAETIAGNAPLTVSAVKQIVAESLKDDSQCDRDLCQQLIDTCYASQDYKEGRQAFMQKRKADFRGH
jgi:enoyl-CoA hydratase